MCERALREIYGKTDRHCQSCGDPIKFENRGWRATVPAGLGSAKPPSARLSVGWVRTLAPNEALFLVPSGWKRVCQSRPHHGFCNWESDPRGSALRCAIAGFSVDATSHPGNGEKHRPQSSGPLDGWSPGRSPSHQSDPLQRRLQGRRTSTAAPIAPEWNELN
jgi:hypothetical protein